MRSISVVIPAYNASVFLSDAIKSLRFQTRLPNELIIIDDGSTDNTLEIAQNCIAEIHEFSVRVILKENSGVSHSRNVGIQEAQGDLVALLDADDYLESEHLELLENGFNYGENIQLVFGSSMYYDETLANKIRPLATRTKSLECSENKIGVYNILNSEKLFQALFPASFIAQSAIMFRKTENLTLFDTRFSQGEDWLFLLYMARSGSAIYVDRDVAKIRRHKANATNADTPENNMRMLEGLFAIKKYLHKQSDLNLNEQNLSILNKSINKFSAEYNYHASLLGLINYLTRLSSNNPIIKSSSVKDIAKSIARAFVYSLKRTNR